MMFLYPVGIGVLDPIPHQVRFGYGRHTSGRVHQDDGRVEIDV
jgi:hypothetical protein